MSTHKKDYIFYIIVIAFSVFYMVATTQIQSANNTAIIGPKFWPLTMLISMTILSVLGIIKTYVNSKKRFDVEEEVVEEEEKENRLFKIPLSIVSILFITAYSLGVFYIGFLLATVSFIFIFTQILGAKKKVWLFILSIIITAVFVLLFSKVLSVPLPRGIGVFRELSFMFY